MDSIRKMLAFSMAKYCKFYRAHRILLPLRVYARKFTESFSHFQPVQIVNVCIKQLARQILVSLSMPTSKLDSRGFIDEVYQPYCCVQRTGVINPPVKKATCYLYVLMFPRYLTCLCLFEFSCPASLQPDFSLSFNASYHIFLFVSHQSNSCFFNLIVTILTHPHSYLSPRRVLFELIA